MTTEPQPPSLNQITLQTAQDFIDALRHRPQFQEEVLRHLLTAEFLTLPEQFRQLQKDVTDHRQEFLDHRQEFLELRQEFRDHRQEFLDHRREFQELRHEFLEHRHEFWELRREFQEHRKEFLELRREFQEHRQEFLEHRKEFLEFAQKTNDRLAALETGQKELRQGQEELKQGQREMRADINDMRAELTRVGGNVSNLSGKDYEHHAARYTPRRLRMKMGLSNVEAIATPRDDSRLHAIADAAFERGAISDAEADDLLMADLAFAATGPDGEPRQVLAEVSITAEAHDCERAARRAEILARATGIPTTPAVISETAPEALVNAHHPEITFLNIPYRN